MGFQRIQLGNKYPQQNHSKSILFNLEKDNNDLSEKIPINYTVEHCSIREDSIIDTVDTGFGGNNTIHQDCKNPEYKIPLYKENYLGEFKEETEKIKVRENLEIYSKTEVNKIISEIIANDSGTFITKLEVEQMIENLDFVDSTLRAKANYDIPNNLFKL